MGRSSDGRSTGLIAQVVAFDDSKLAVVAPTVTGVTESGATLGGNVAFDGGAAITERGVVFAKTGSEADPTVEGGARKVVASGTTGVFTVPVANLEGSVSYTFKAYATNDGGVTYQYSRADAFTVLGKALVSEPTSAGITATSATLGGNVTSDGGAAITARGVYFIQGSGPTLPKLATAADVTTVTASGTTGVFTVNVSGLTAGTDYTFVAYAINSLGTAYSSISTFKTAAALLPADEGPVAFAALDASFALAVSGQHVQATAVQPDGKTIIGGFFEAVGNEDHPGLARLNVDGTVDSTFNPTTDGDVYSIAVQADGQILIGGLFTAVNNVGRNFFARLNPDGTLESTSTFHPGSGADYPVTSIAVQADGKILLAGEFTQINTTARARIARLDADGDVDGTFDPGTGPDGAVFCVVPQADGKVLLGGAFENVNGAPRSRFARLNAGGSVEGTGSFNMGTGADDWVTSMAVQANGDILLGGDFTTVKGTGRNRIARLTSDGTLDAVFNPNVDARVSSVAPQANGKIVIGGAFQIVSGAPRSRIARLNADGSAEGTATFNVGTGADSEVNAVALQRDGGIVLGGGFTKVNGTDVTLIARLDNDAATQTLTVPDATKLQWMRGGAAPEVAQVTFEQTADGGATWTKLGNGARIAGGWELGGQALPPIGTFRARGRTTGGYLNASSGIVEQLLTFSPTKGGLVNNGAGLTFGAFGAARTGAFAGTVQAGRAKSPAIFGSNGQVLLQVGVGNVAKLGAPSGGVALVTLKAGVTKANNVQLFTGLNSGTPVVSAQTGTTLTGLPTGVKIKKFLAVDGNGPTPFALVTLTGTGITGANDTALCAVLGVGNVTIVAQEGQSVTIGATTRPVKTLATLVVSKGTLAANRWRVDGDSFGVRVTFPDKQGAIFAVPATATSAADWALMTQTGAITAIPELNGLVAGSFGLPGFGSASVAQVVNFAKGPGVSARNNAAITSGNAADGFKLLARKGADAPGATGAALGGTFFKSLADPLSGANGATAFAGTITGRLKGSGIWLAADGATTKLLARSGDLAPGGGRWKAFTTLAMPDGAHGPIFLATLATSAADGVTKANSFGLWAVDSTGTLRLMFRTGRDASVNGVAKPVKAFTALTPAKGTLGAASGYDNAGNIAVLATFTDGTQALLTVTVP